VEINIDYFEGVDEAVESAAEDDETLAWFIHYYRLWGEPPPEKYVGEWFGIADYQAREFINRLKRRIWSKEYDEENT